SLTGFLSRGREDGVYPGAVAVVGSAEGIDHAAAVGARDPEREEPMTRSALFDAASLTKPVVTTTIALALVESGVVALSDTIGRYTPAVNDRQSEIRLVDPLTHSSGLQPYAFSESWESRDDALAGLADRTLLSNEPGTHHEYSCL